MGIKQGIEQGIALNQFEVYQTMLLKVSKKLSHPFSVSKN